jgi:hypothetical protein
MPIPVASMMIENKREVSNDTADKPTSAMDASKIRDVMTSNSGRTAGGTPATAG